MKFLTLGFLLSLLLVSPALAATEDTFLFRTRMLPENEVPALNIPGATGNATITVRVTRDIGGAVNAATVIFDIDYAMPSTTTFVGLHIHNAPAGVNGSVVINSGLSSGSSVVGTSGRITRTVNYSSTDTTQLRTVSGLLSNPALYYVNIHSTVNPAGVLRGQLQASNISFRPALLPSNEVPAIMDLDAQGAALITVRANRNANGDIVSGVVLFEVDYRFPGAVTIVGMHIHNGATGTNGPVVISSGIASSQPIVSSTGRGRILRVAEVTSASGLTALNGLFSNPSDYYLNVHTSVHTGGAIRGQLARDEISFFSRMEGAQEVPPVTVTGGADALTHIRVTRDAAGNINGGSMQFNVAFEITPGPITFVGLHIHRARLGVNGSVVLNSGLGTGANSVVSNTGVGTITRDVTFSSTDTGPIAAMEGLFVDPESYYINLHSTVNTGGVVRGQLARETFHFRPQLSPANEVPAITSTASGTGWITMTVDRNPAGDITAGTVTFDVDYNLAGTGTIVGMHIHRGVAGVNGPVVINSGVPSTASSTGVGNVTTTAVVSSSDTAGLTALADIIRNPAGFYLNLHTATNPGGLLRAQLLSLVNFLPQAVGGADWITSVTVTNSSSTASAHGILHFLNPQSDPVPSQISAPALSFWLPPSGSVTFNTHNRGSVVVGPVRVHSSAPVNLQAAYFFPGLGGSGNVSAATANSVSIPVSFGSGGTRNTGVALLLLDGSVPDVLFTLRDSSGALVPGGIRAARMSGAYLSGLIADLVPGPVPSSFSGTLTIELRRGYFFDGTMSVLALQFDAGSMAPANVTVLR